MENILIIFLIIIVFVLVITIILFLAKLVKIEARYNNFISKFDNKESIEETLRKYISIVNNLSLIHI